ncbi:MAG: hypothetical protein DHS20C13_27310 [Thermodesulfobacteriota bacterium]|nr:MAG: hypothetical protein DHS20C13_27310 [Thermodesulfobacteriota bacterium]
MCVYLEKPGSFSAAVILVCVVKHVSFTTQTKEISQTNRVGNSKSLFVESPEFGDDENIQSEFQKNF